MTLLILKLSRAQVSKKEARFNEKCDTGNRSLPNGIESGFAPLNNFLQRPSSDLITLVYC